VKSCHYASHSRIDFVGKEVHGTYTGLGLLKSDNVRDFQCQGIVEDPSRVPITIDLAE